MRTDKHEEANKRFSRVTQKRLTTKYVPYRILETAEPSFGLVDGKSEDTRKLVTFLLVFLTQPQSLFKANIDNSKNGYTYFTDNIIT